MELKKIMKRIKNMKKITAFTLAETVMVILIVGLIAVALAKISPGQLGFAQKCNYYATFINLKRAVGETIAEGYYNSTTEETENNLPLHGYVGDGTGLCERFTKTLNTLGTVVCNRTTTSTFNDATVNFTATNGTKYYNMGADPTNVGGADPTLQIYTLYIDIDGNRGTSTLNDDVMEFIVSRDGLVLPGADSSGANDADYLSTNIKYTDNSGGTAVISWLARGITYKQAACQSGEVTDATYCGIYSELEACSVINTQCEVTTNPP